MSDTKAKLKEMIVERLFLKVEPSAIKDDANLMDEYGVDSVRLFEIVEGLEEVFNVCFDEDDFEAEDFSTVSRIAVKVEELS